ncbi:MAG: hypothetical protein IH942_07590, partial [Acidobacteria bacterium]|nr:hypothetical protein [Acidobacteriota bacterium]
TEALATYREFREALAEESGLDPSPELQDLELRILQQDPSLGPALQQPIGPGVAIALPARYSSFVGRDREVAAGPS